MSGAIPFVLVIVLYSVIIYCRRPGRGGVIGSRVRNSDWLAWRDSVHDAERRLEQLRANEPRL